MLNIPVDIVLSTKNLAVDLNLSGNLNICKKLDAEIFLRYRVTILDDILHNQIVILTIDDVVEQVNKKLV